MFERSSAGREEGLLPLAPLRRAGGAGASDLETFLTADPAMPADPFPLGPVDLHEGALDVEAPFAWPDVPDPVATWERVAGREQDRLLDPWRPLRQKDSERTIGLLNAYEASMQDLEHRKGSHLGGPARSVRRRSSRRWACSCRCHRCTSRTEYLPEPPVEDDDCPF